MPRPFLLWPNPCLSSAAAPVEGVDDGVRSVWEEMLAAMYAMPGQGVGLAAPQLGIGLRLAVLDCSETRDQPVRLANPRLLSAAEETRSYPEASPNLPGLSAEVTRPVWVEVTYMDETGAEVSQRFDGLWATSVQHQMDHLDGRVFIDNLGPVRRQRLLTAYRKQRRKA